MLKRDKGPGNRKTEPEDYPIAENKGSWHKGNWMRRGGSVGEHRKRGEAQTHKG